MSDDSRKTAENDLYVGEDKTGARILHDPLLNKGTAFSERERDELGLVGLLPPHVSSLDEQLRRVYDNFCLKANNIEKFVFLRALQDRNETLFYALLKAHIEEMTPIIYTPTVGEAVQKGSHIYRHSRGLYISPENIYSIDNMVKNLPSAKIDVIVVTDNQGILGIGDQGIGGMGIPIGKLSLYTAGAGIAPGACLPICLDVGTDNEALLDDPLYLGNKHKRLRGEEYTEFIDRFLGKIKSAYPGVLLQWEDFSKQNAFSNMDRYRDSVLSFNDDIQGTGAMALAGILGSLRIIKRELADQKFVVFGAGAGGVGVARQIRVALMDKGDSKSEALSKIFVVDSRGLILNDRKSMDEYKTDLATNRDRVRDWKIGNPDRITFLETIENSGATVLLGLSGQPGTITKQVVEAMSANAPVPIIFPLSNPTKKVEARPEDIYQWTNGSAIVATGSPFADVKLGERTFRIGQGNNVFIFPGIGLGALAANATSVTDGMFTAAAYRLACLTPSDARETHAVFPTVSDIYKVSKQVALAVFNQAIKDGVANVNESDRPLDLINKRIWNPVYPEYRLKNAG